MMSYAQLPSPDTVEHCE